MSYPRILDYLPQPLENLKIHSDGKINFRCIVCGDSTKKKKVARGWLLPIKGGSDLDYHYECFRGCSRGHILKILKKRFPSYYDTYIQEYKKFSIDRLRNDKNNYNEKENNITKKKNKVEGLSNKITFKSLNKDKYIPVLEHDKALSYCLNRKIPMEYIKGFYVSVDISKQHFGMLCMPLYDDKNEIYGLNFRSLDKYAYIIKKINGNVGIWNIFNIDNEKNVFILEAMIDAMFVKNSIALLGVSKNENENLISYIKKPVYLFDNDEAGWKGALKMSKQGYNICYLFEYFEKYGVKDINQFILEINDDIDELNRTIIANLLTPEKSYIKLKLYGAFKGWKEKLELKDHKKNEYDDKNFAEKVRKMLTR